MADARPARCSISGTVNVSGTFDGGMKTYCCIGDGSQGESQDPMFEIANGGTLQNVILGSPAGDGVHCLGTCTIRNVWWNDIGEDAATFLSTSGGTSYVIGGGARSGSDKTFQHNGNGTVNISGFYLNGAGKLYRGCGNCTNSYQRHVVINNVLLNDVDMVAGINTNWGDTATITRVTVTGGDATVCGQVQGRRQGQRTELPRRRLERRQLQGQPERHHLPLSRRYVFKGALTTRWAPLSTHWASSPGAEQARGLSSLPRRPSRSTC